MKFHAYPKLLLSVGALALSAMCGASAQAAVDASALAVERTAPGTVLATDTQGSAASSQEKNLLALLGQSQRTTAFRGGSCGDSAPGDGEQCDDGNTTSGDGCSATCQVEPNFDCTAAIAGLASENIMGDGSFELNDGSWTLSGSAFSPRCSPTTCGPDLATDGSFYLWIGGGFFTAGNGGTASQTLVIPTNATDLTFEWASGSNAPAGCEDLANDRLEVLIDGVERFRSPNPCVGVFPYETVTIDLAGLGLNDGGSHTIVFNGFNIDDPADPGATLTNFFVDNVQVNVPLVDPIPPTPSACFEGVCGDSIATDAEECDDGNTASGDGCSATCTIEQPDWVCSDPSLTSFDILASATGDAVVEGSLEDRRGRQSGAWTESRVGATDLLPICTEVFCSFISINIATDGIFYALFGASADPSDTSISQDVTIPAGANTLTFDMLVAICDSADDFLVATIDGTEVFRYDCVTDTDDYESYSADISAFADGGTHTLAFRGNTVATNGGNTNFFVDNISIPLATAAVPAPSDCFERATACDTIEEFNAGIPAGWTVINLGPDSADGWGTTGDGTCLAENASDLADFFGDNLTTGAGGAACADSDATGQVDIDGGAPEANEMDTYLCSPALDLSTVTGPQYSFNTYYSSANNQFNDNGTPDDFTDDFDEDLLEVVVGTNAPNQLTISNYTRLGGVNDHEDGNLILTGAQELVANLEGSELEGAAEGYVCFHYKGTYAWFAQVDNAGLRGDDCNLAPVDTDGDGVFDSTDNCTAVANPDQIDSNGDGIGNRCDADITGDCIVNFIDFAPFQGAFGSAEGDANYDADRDFNSDGFINFLDLGLYPAQFGGAPGPSANGCDAQ